jgi:hypothetical protein
VESEAAEHFGCAIVKSLLGYFNLGYNLEGCLDLHLANNTPHFIASEWRAEVHVAVLQLFMGRKL